MKAILKGIAGVFIGMATVIPGVSAGTIAVILQVYEDFLAVTSVNVKKILANWKYLLIMGIGVVIGVVVFANLIKVVYAKFPVYTNFFFVGIVVGSIPFLFSLLKNAGSQPNETETSQDVFKHHTSVENYTPETSTSPKTIMRLTQAVLFILGFAVMLVLFLAKDTSKSNQVVIENLSPSVALPLFGAGAVAAASMVIPGISGSFLLLVLGYYEPVIKAISEFQVGVLVIFGLGLVCGLVVASRLLIKGFEKYAPFVYALIFGLVIGSILQIMPLTAQSPIGYAISALCLVCGCALVILFTKLGKEE